MCASTPTRRKVFDRRLTASLQPSSRHIEYSRYLALTWSMLSFFESSTASFLHPPFVPPSCRLHASNHSHTSFGVPGMSCLPTPLFGAEFLFTRTRDPSFRREYPFTTWRGCFVTDSPTTPEFGRWALPDDRLLTMKWALPTVTVLLWWA